MKLNLTISIVLSTLLCSLISLYPKTSHALKKVLIVGDSHIYGPFGEHLHQDLSSQFDVTSVGAVGATVRTYVSEDTSKRTAKWGARFRNLNGSRNITKNLVVMPKLTALAKQVKPDILVMELGDNFAGYKDHSDQDLKSNLKMFKQDLAKLPASIRCIWITPNWTNQPQNPYHKTNARLTAVNSEIVESLRGKCQVINSTTELGLAAGSMKTVKDGLHYQKSSGELWADRVMPFIAVSTSDKPSDRISRIQ